MSDESIHSFIDLDEPGEPAELPTLDRSTLELVADCPMSQRLVGQHKPAPKDIMEIGQAVHEVYGAIVTDWVNSGGAIGQADLADAVRDELARARPDVARDAVMAASGSAWIWAQYLREIHPDNFLGWDGGPEGKTGQLSHQIAGVIVTSEIDLLHAGPSRSQLHEIDIKSGFKTYTASMVRESFQFAVHAWLVFQNFPAIDSHEIRVLNTRDKSLTPPVEFKREWMPNDQSRIEAAVKAWRNNRAPKPLVEVDAWPTVEKCERCDVSRWCVYRPSAERTIEADPQAAVGELIAIEEKRSAIKKALTSYAKKNGPIPGPDGVVYGCDKPKKTRNTYEVYKPTEGGE